MVVLLTLTFCKHRPVRNIRQPVIPLTDCDYVKLTDQIKGNKLHYSYFGYTKSFENSELLGVWDTIQMSYMFFKHSLGYEV